MRQFWRTKSIDTLIRTSEDPGRKLSKSLGLWSLVCLGIGAVIGSGIFTVSGTAAAGQTLAYGSVLHAPVLDLLLHGSQALSLTGRPGAGPGISLSFVLVAFACAFAGLCYAELASMIPIAGSAYTYAYATLGELVAWILGWDLILEYAVSNMSVAVGFSAYLNDLFDNLFGLHLPAQWSQPMLDENLHFTGAYFNLPAFLVLMALTWLLVRGVREGAGANNAMVVVKIFAVLLFVGGAMGAIRFSNYHPFLPNGMSGVITGAAIVFFAFIGFDSVSTAAEECRNPQRDLPLGILITLIICTLLYVAVALVLTGIANWKTLDNAAPVARALKDLGLNQIRGWVTIGALVGMLSSLLVFQYGQARVWFAMSRDRLLPDAFSRVHARFQTPHVSTIIAGIVVGIPSGVFDIGTLADLANIGTLFAFIVVSVGVLALRRRQPDRVRSFRVPWAPWLPLLSVACCLLLMLGMPLETWLRFFVWLLIGMLIYLGYGRHRTPHADW
ncbi:MAG: amino acid permease [Pseudomonadota bacterium]|nr:amino acid permease [Pseudomonadota bacterium]